MKCPFCASEEDKVVDSSTSRDGTAVRRRRECNKCLRRFTTYEYVENISHMVVKRDGRVEPFDRQKLRNSLITACKKRPIKLQKIDALTNEIEDGLQVISQIEIKSSDIGETVMSKLRNLDEVAYVRFASVYKEFKDREAFMHELQQLSTRQP